VDVAHALEVMLDAENTSMGQTFSLAGPRSYTIAEMMQLVEALTYNKIVRPALNVPKPILMTASKLAQLAWWPMLSPDEVTQRFLDCKPDEPGTKSWADLGIEPDLLEEVAIMYLRRYRCVPPRVSPELPRRADLLICRTGPTCTSRRPSRRAAHVSRAASSATASSTECLRLRRCVAWRSTMSRE
jgi:hypothetical protein